MGSAGSGAHVRVTRGGRGGRVGGKFFFCVFSCNVGWTGWSCGRSCRHHLFFFVFVQRGLDEVGCVGGNYFSKSSVS